MAAGSDMNRRMYRALMNIRSGQSLTVVSAGCLARRSSPVLLRIPEQILNFVAVIRDPFRMSVCVRVLKKVYLEPGQSDPTPT